jgi:hypothetical protein
MPCSLSFVTAFLRSFMPKLIALLSACAACLTVASLSSQTLAQPVSSEHHLGICGVDRLTGRSVVDASGRVVPLVEYCQQEATARRSLGVDGDRFLETFTTVASPDALAFSQTLDPQLLVEYGTTICPFLAGGGSMREVRLIQRDGLMPTNVEAAITVAAIHTYCPEFVSRIGRQ